MLAENEACLWWAQRNIRCECISLDSTAYIRYQCISSGKSPSVATFLHISLMHEVITAHYTSTNENNNGDVQKKKRTQLYGKLTIKKNK